MRSVFLACIVTGMTLAGCGSAVDPLGGPYGGTAPDPAPNGGNGDPAGGDSGAVEPLTGGNQGNGGNGSDAGGGTMGSGSDSGQGQGASKDAGAPPPPEDSGAHPQDSGSPGTVETWTQLYTTYLARNTIGNCGACHSSMNSTPTKAYSWLQQKHQLPGPNPGLVDPNNSYLSWYGGNMPPGGPNSEPTATTQMNAWAAAGAPNN